MRRILGRFLFIILAVVVVGALYIYSRLPPDAYQCASQDEPISQTGSTGKFSIEMTQTVCGGIAFSSTVFLAIRSEQSNQKTTFLSYGRGTSDPKLEWIGDNVLVVQLSDVEEIYTEAAHVGDVQIRYQIGKILTKQRPRRN
ncbi:hypothetical protein JQ621_14020 [Bradyrhizobium manausense]|nr:hypothetical protein [Bradyrhizobium manausense]